VERLSWRLRVRHTTGYQYPQEVAASYNEVRLTPATTVNQIAIDTRIDVSPPVRLESYVDYWGTIVHSFDVHVPHTELVVTATSLVETPEAHTVATGVDLSWNELDDQAVRDAFHEHLVPTRSTGWDTELAEVALAVRNSAPPATALERVVAWVHDALSYEKGSTNVSTSAVEAWHAGRGVCQDFVHLTLALLRAMGIPARYVSGYLHPRDDAEVGEVVAGESHAWAEAWLGEWRAFDPTNAAAVGPRHVLVARGRDYGDVTPVKGVYSGAPSSTPTVTVELTRLPVAGAVPFG
jgi:transglutaminase-like putative cysteine protease